MNLQNWKWAGGIGLFALLLIGNVWQMYQRSQYRADLIQARNNETFWHMQYLYCKQSQDTITGIGNYGQDSVIVRGKPAKILNPATNAGTLAESGTITPTIIDTCLKAALMRFITFGTTRYFGEKSNPLGVRVWGKFYTDPAFKSQNKLLIQALGWNDPAPTQPVEPAISKWQLDLFGGGGLLARKAVYGLGLAYGKERTKIWAMAIGNDTGNWGGMTGIQIGVF